MRSLAAMLASLLLAAAAARAQPVVTPTPERPDELENVGAYTISNSFEFGYRLADVSGNRDAYRSAVNFGNGVRLFEGQLRIHSEDGQGGLFDEFAFRTSGLGQDPFQTTTLRVEKNGAYRYDMQFRIVNYFNRLPALWSGEHGLNTERIFQNHSLTLFPGKRFEVFLGYDRNNRNGPGFSSEGIADSVGALDRSNFLRFRTNLKQLNNQYRGGVSFRAAGLAVTVMQSLDNYKEDTIYRDASGLPSLAGNVQPVESLARAEPIHGNTPVTSVTLRTEKERAIGFHGRYVYSSGERNSFLRENLTALDSNSGPPTMRQTFILGDAGRKQGSGDFTVTLLPSARWTISNTTAINNMRIDGTSSLLEISLFENQFVTFEHLGVRHITNATEVQFRPVSQVSLFGAYRYSNRRVRSQQLFEFPDFDFDVPLLGVDNEIHSGGGGLRWMPGKGVRVSFDAEVGRANMPLTPVSDRRFHNETARVQWRRKNLTLGARFQNKVNNNPVSIVDYESESRSAGFQGSYASADGRHTLFGSYTFLNFDSAAGIFNFLAPDPTQELARNFYTSSLHTGNFGARTELTERLVIWLGYTLAKDTAGGRRELRFDRGVTPNYPLFAVEGVDFFNAFPLTYQSPQARLSIRLHDKLEWNFGWQFYHYNERFSGAQNYHAHIGYSSFRIRL